MSEISSSTSSAAVSSGGAVTDPVTSGVVSSGGTVIDPTVPEPQHGATVVAPPAGADGVYGGPGAHGFHRGGRLMTEIEEIKDEARELKRAADRAFHHDSED